MGMFGDDENEEKEAKKSFFQLTDTWPHQEHESKQNGSLTPESDTDDDTLITLGILYWLFKK